MSISTSRTPHHGGAGTGLSVAAPDRTDVSSVGSASGSGPLSRSRWARPRVSTKSASRFSSSTSWSILARPSKASLQ
jgi:hypothetical protein